MDQTNAEELGPVRRLRVMHVVVQPVLVWDDGEELEAGPGIDPLALPVSLLAEFAANLPAQVAEIANGFASTGEG